MSCFDLISLPTSPSTLTLTVLRDVLVNGAKRSPNRTVTSDAERKRQDYALFTALSEFCVTTKIYQFVNTSLSTAADTETVDASGLTALDDDKLLAVDLVDSDGEVEPCTIVSETQLRSALSHGGWSHQYYYPGGPISWTGENTWVSITKTNELRFAPTPTEVKTVRVRYWGSHEMELSDIGTTAPDDVTFAMPVEIAFPIVYYGAVPLYDQDFVNRQDHQILDSKFQNHILKYMGYGQERVQAVYANRDNY